VESENFLSEKMRGLSFGSGAMIGIMEANFCKLHLFQVSLRDLVSKSAPQTIISTLEKSGVGRAIMNDVFKNLNSAFEAVRRRRVGFV
jgi:hypothetical protein